MDGTGAVVHLVLLGGSVLTTTALGGYAWRRRREPGARAFVALMVAFTVFSGLHAAGLLTRDPALRIVLEAAQWVGVTALPVCWMAFALTYTGHDRLTTPRTLAALSVVPAVTLGLVVTNPLHGLVFVENVPREVAGLVLVEQTFGPWFWVFIAYTYLLLGAGSVLLVRLIVASDFLYADQSVLLLVGVAAPWLANVLTLLEVTPLGEPALDMTPYAFTVTGVAFGYATFRHRLLDLVPATRQLGRQAAVSGLEEGVLILDAARRLVYCNAAAADVLDCDRTAMLGEPVDEVLDPSALAFDAPDGLATLRRDGRTYEARTSPVEGRGGGVIGHTVVLNDVTAREERERKLRRQRDELEALEALNGVIRGVNRALVDAATVEDVETAVADRLADSTLYDAVRVTVTAPRLADDARAHVTDAPAGEDDAPLSEGEDGAVAWLASQAPDDAADAFSPTDGGRDVADDGGTWAVVPATYGRTVYGVLAVRSDREDGVGERELAVLGELGELAGHAVNAVRSRRLLTAEAGVELVFGCDDGDRLAALAGAADAALTLEGVTPLSGTELLVDLAVEGDDEAVERTVAAAERAAAESADVIEARPTAADRVELTVAGGSVLFPLVELGARVRSLSAEDGRARVVAEFHPGVDVRAVTERVEATVPGTSLLARHERERAPGLPSDDGDDPDVTDRQREALEEAYRAGYFEWPRESTAEEVADEMDITSPTFQQHLRAAHRKLLDAYVDEEPRRGGDSADGD